MLEHGYEVDVFTRYKVSREELTSKKICSNLYGLYEYKPQEQYSDQQKHHGFLYSVLYRMYLNLKNIVCAKQYCKAFAYQLSHNTDLCNKQYDVAFSTFGPLSSLFCGMYYKKTHPETRWVCDFRDPVVVKYVNFLFKPYYAYIQRKACKKADAIVAVSNGYLERICKGKFKEKSYMLPNGYDLEDALLKPHCEGRSNQLQITYVGALYGGDRDLSPLFRAISELVEENLIKAEDISLHYAGREFHVLEKQAEPYNMKNILVDYGTLTRENCLKLQFGADILLLSTWNNKDEYGVFPGKILEYMLIGKPIISLTNGDMPSGEITQVIREGHLGIAYEDACDAIDFPKLKEYIKTCYDEIKTGGNIKFSPEQAVLDRYNYDFVIEKLEKILKNG